MRTIIKICPACEERSISAVENTPLMRCTKCGTIFDIKEESLKIFDESENNCVGEYVIRFSMFIEKVEPEREEIMLERHIRGE